MNDLVEPQAHAPEPHDSEMVFTNTPNLLTLSRIAFVPCVVYCLTRTGSSWELAAAILFTVAAITDYFDGYIARAQKSVTVYGKLMDPLADKFLVISSLIMLQAMGRVPPVVVILLICREVGITGLRALASSEGVIIPASGSAKWKTAAQMVAIPVLMLKDGMYGEPLFVVGTWLLYISLGISLWSAHDYVFDFFKALKAQRKLKAEKRRARKAARKARLKSQTSPND